jgi:hypothetical protein
MIDISLGREATMGTALPPTYPPGFIERSLTGCDLLFLLGIAMLPAIILYFWLMIERYLRHIKEAPDAKH